MDSPEVDRTMTRTDEVKKKILMRVEIGLNRSLCLNLEGLIEALKRTDVRKKLE